MPLCILVDSAVMASQMGVAVHNVQQKDVFADAHVGQPLIEYAHGADNQIFHRDGERQFGTRSGRTNGNTVVPDLGQNTYSPLYT